MPRLALGGLRNRLSHLVRPPFPAFFLGWHFPSSWNFVNWWMWVGSHVWPSEQFQHIYQKSLEPNCSIFGVNRSECHMVMISSVMSDVKCLVSVVHLVYESTSKWNIIVLYHAHPIRKVGACHMSNVLPLQEGRDQYSPRTANVATDCHEWVAKYCLCGMSLKLKTAMKEADTVQKIAYVPQTWNCWST